MRRLLISAAAVALSTTSASAASFLVTTGVSFDIPANNNFRPQLLSLGLNDYTSLGAILTLSGPARVTFHYMGSESGFTDHFSAAGGAVFGTETGTPLVPVNNFFGGALIGSAIFGGGPVDFTFSSSSSGAEDPAMAGSGAFGIFIPGVAGAGTPLPGTGYATSVLYFGYDDQLTGDDDNHDDFIVRATISAIPEPATWAMMIGGFGLVGGMMRVQAKKRAELNA